MCGENLATQANPSGEEVNSTDLHKPVKSAEEKAKWAAYIREYRKRRKLAAAVANSAGIPDGMSGDKSSPVEPPDAA